MAKNQNLNKKILLIIIPIIILTSCWTNSKEETNTQNITQNEINIENTEKEKNNKKDLSIQKPDWKTLKEIEEILKSTKELSEILKLYCETSLYPSYKPWNNTSHMDYNIIKKCYDLVRKYETSYYENYIKKDPKVEIVIPNDFNKEYEKYKKGVWKYEDYINSFELTNKWKTDCWTAAWWDNPSCSPVSKVEFLKTMWRIMSYSEFEKMKQNEINSQRENMVNEQKRFKEILESMK